MVGGRVGRYIRIGLYTTFGLFFFFFFLNTFPHILLAYSDTCSDCSACCISRPPETPSWSRSPRCSPPLPAGRPKPDFRRPPRSSPKLLGPEVLTALCERWARLAEKGREETRTHLLAWNLLLERPTPITESGQSERCPAVLTRLLWPEQKTSQEMVWEPGGQWRRKVSRCWKA